MNAMPPDFGLSEMIDDGSQVSLIVPVDQASDIQGKIALAFMWNDTTRARGEDFKWMLRQSVWQALELVRLGRASEILDAGYVKL